jgi:hypothetical protein
MSRLRSATRGGLLVSVAALLMGSGCAPAQVEVVGPAAATPDYVPPPPAYGPAPAAGPADVETDVAYEDAPPVDDIEDYPSVEYEGAPVFYVGGVWYRHDRRGWGVYRREPQALSERRAQHERDPRWVQAAQRRPEVAARPAAPGRPAVPENRPPEPQRRGVTEWQSAPPRAQPTSPRTAPVQPAGAGHPMAAPPARPEVRTDVRPAPAPRGGRPPAHAAPSPEHR